jgi:hypothetical protein
MSSGLAVFFVAVERFLLYLVMSPSLSEAGWYSGGVQVRYRRDMRAGENDVSHIIAAGFSVTIIRELPVSGTAFQGKRSEGVNCCPEVPVPVPAGKRR